MLGERRLGRKWKIPHLTGVGASLLGFQNASCRSRESALRWQAEGGVVSRGTGELETDIRRVCTCIPRPVAEAGLTRERMPPLPRPLAPPPPNRFDDSSPATAKILAVARRALNPGAERPLADVRRPLTATAFFPPAETPPGLLNCCLLVADLLCFDWLDIISSSDLVSFSSVPTMLKSIVQSR